MARSYDTRPNLEGYDALTVRGIAKFAVVIGLLLGAQFLADHYGFGRWLSVAILGVQFAVGLKVMWIGGKALMSGGELPNAIAGPRYAEPDAINFVSPRAAAFGEIIGGAVIIADAAFKLSQIFQGAH
jgi:hypothetical protein